MAKDNHTGRKLAIGALIAGAAGYVTGLLTAPKSGKETRADIADKAGELREDAEAKLQVAHDELGDVLKKTKTKAGELSAKAKAEFNEAVWRAKDAQGKTAKVIQAIRAGHADDRHLDRALKQARQAKKNLAKYLRS